MELAASCLLIFLSLFSKPCQLLTSELPVSVKGGAAHCVHERGFLRTCCREAKLALSDVEFEQPVRDIDLELHVPSVAELPSVFARMIEVSRQLSDLVEPWLQAAVPLFPGAAAGLAGPAAGAAPH